jgi:DNA polymerase
VQPHNFVKAHIKDMEVAWRALKELERPAGMDTLAQALRGAIVSAPGKALFVADYASIEARVLHWLAEDEDTLDLFRTGADLYCVMASDIYQRTITKADVNERALGKIAVLGLGYQMGWTKFRDTCATFKIEIDDELAQKVVTTYRERFWLVRDMWQEQNDAAIETLQTREPVQQGKVTWLVDGRFLYAVLPSGRKLAYADPQLQSRNTPWGSRQLVVSFKGVNPKTHQWQRQHTYGGAIVENLVQAIARDVMADAMLRVAQSGVYQLVLSVHDELVAEAHPAWGSVQDFLDLLTTLPTWAKGCPIAAEGWQGFRYRK